MGCIYMFTNQVNQKRYIGQCSVNIKQRYSAHINGHGSQVLKRAIDKYGIENFTFEILHDGILDIFLDDYEKDSIKKYNAKVPNGYNLTDGGEGSLNPSEETRRKISKAGKGKPKSVETRRRISEASKGKIIPTEQRRKISEALKGKYGKPHSDETRRRISESLKGKKHFQYGKSLPNETRQKISESLKGKSKSAETRRRMSEAHKGKTLSDETRRRISEARRRPEYNEAHNFFYSLPPNMPIKEKRKQLYVKHSNIKKRTIRKWTQQWQAAEVEQ